MPSPTFTPALNLKKPYANQPGWDAIVNAFFDFIDALAPLRSLAVAANDIDATTGAPTSLKVKVAFGSFVKHDGTIFSYTGTGSPLTLAAGSTTNVWLTDAGALSSGASWPAANHVRLATVVTGATTVTSIADARITQQSRGVLGMRSAAADAGDGVTPAAVFTGPHVALDASRPLNFVDCRGRGPVTADLPPAATVAPGSVLTVMDTSGSARKNAIVIRAHGSDMINGGHSTSITANYAGVRLWCDGASRWFLVP